jgi:hypothetical protein
MYDFAAMRAALRGSGARGFWRDHVELVRDAPTVPTHRFCIDGPRRSRRAAPPVP